MKTICVRIDDETYRQAMMIAAWNDAGMTKGSRDSGISRVVKDALDHHIVRNERVIRQTIRQQLSRMTASDGVRQDRPGMVA